MKANLGPTDKIIRLSLASLIAFLFFNVTIYGTFGFLLLVLAFILALTSLMNHCPLYSFLRISTNKEKKREMW